MNDKIRVLIADDHLHEREGFKHLLSLVDDITVIGEATSAQEAVQKTLNLKPDVVLLDLTWFKDQTAGISATKQIKSNAPGTKILVATVYSELIERARHAGADLAVDKDTLFDKDTLAARIRDASRCDRFPSPEQIQPNATGLSKREIEVLQLIARGETDRSSALQLGISLPTVKKHVSSILSKLGVPNRAAAAVAALERGILTREDDLEES